MEKIRVILEKIRGKVGEIPVPGWLFVLIMVLYNELMLHIWSGETFLAGRMLALTAFALGFGGVLALLVSLLPSARAEKWGAVIVSVLVSIVCLTEYFILDAYKSFMAPATVIGGAGGVAGDFLDIVISLVARNLWRIALILLPVVLYGVFCQSRRTSWKLRGALAAGTVVLYLLGFGCAFGLTNDAARFREAYDFDSVVRVFGLNMALTLDIGRSAAPEQEPSFLAVPEPAPAPTEQTEAAESLPETTEPPVVYEPNVLKGVDFEALAASEKSGNIASIHSYVASQTPTMQNEYTGLFKGKNLILITAEAFTSEVIDPELTPTLYRLANRGIRFTDYYQPAWGASTTSGEFSNLIGLVPTNGGSCMKETIQQNFFLTMGHQLQKQGYTSIAYHNHFKDFYDRDRTHVPLGYDQFLARYGGLEGLSPIWPESDLEMMDITVPQYIDKQPFSIYYMTVSGHCPYGRNENAMTAKNYDKVQDMDCSETIKGYYAANLELEYAMESLVNQLEAAGIADDTVIVLATDHYPYGLERSSAWHNATDLLKELYGVESYDNFIRDHNTLIIWSGCIEDKGIQVDDPVYSLDILPTLSNLFGVEYDSRLLVGRDVFSDAEPLVLWPNSSWKTDLGTYNASTGKFTPAEGVQVDGDYVKRISAIVTNKINYSREVLNLDYFRWLSSALGISES
ncbi:MAG: LTA synthase family protein [Firmicutes bacterium]|nr:LTA synthase family protein [Bacillota bacterium]